MGSSWSWICCCVCSTSTLLCRAAALLLLLSTTAVAVKPSPPKIPKRAAVAGCRFALDRQRTPRNTPFKCHSPHPQHFMSTFWSNACSSALNRPLPNLLDYLYTVSGILVRRMRRAAASARLLIHALACSSAAPRFSLSHPRNSPADRLLLLERLRQRLHVRPVAAAGRRRAAGRVAAVRRVYDAHVHWQLRGRSLVVIICDCIL